MLSFIIIIDYVRSDFSSIQRGAKRLLYPYLQVLRKIYGSSVDGKNYFHNFDTLEQLKKGDMVKITRSVFYSHWVIYVGSGKVIHLSGAGIDRGLHLSHIFKISGQISNKTKVCEEDFWAVVRDDKANISNRDADDMKPLDIEIVLKRAEDCKGKIGYHAFCLNCEHFVTWCRYGRPESLQVHRMVNNVCFGAVCSLAAVYCIMFAYQTEKLGIIFKYMTSFISKHGYSFIVCSLTTVATSEVLKLCNITEQNELFKLMTHTNGNLENDWIQTFQTLPQSTAVDDDQEVNQPNINSPSTVTIAEDLRGPDFIQTLTAAVDNDQDVNQPNINPPSTVTIAEDLTGPDFNKASADDIDIRLERMKRRRLAEQLRTTVCLSCQQRDAMCCVSLQCRHVTTCFKCRETIQVCIQHNSHIKHSLDGTSFFRRKSLSF